MRKFLTETAALLLGAAMLFTVISCGGAKVEAKFNDNKIDEILIGEMIDFTEFIDYTEGASADIVYSTPSEKNLETDSVYFLTEELGRHDFKITFTLNGKSATLECSIDVVPPAPEVVRAESSVYCVTGETVSFDALITRSGIRITPARYVDIKFVSAEYANEVISVENYSSVIETTTFGADDKSFTFAKPGSYAFNVKVGNASGVVDTSISVSVLDGAGEYPIDNVASSGVLYGENNAVKIMQGSAGELSYIASKSVYEVKTGEYCMTEVEFSGKNAPQLLFFTEEINGDTALGNGIGVSLEKTIPATSMCVFGPTRFSSSTPLVKRNDTLGKDSLKNGKEYKWRVIVTRISSSKLAIKSQLFEKKDGAYELAGTFNWASFAYAGESKGYIEYLGSASGDIIFRYAAPVKCDKDGNEI